MNSFDNPAAYELCGADSYQESPETSASHRAIRCFHCMGVLTSHMLRLLQEWGSTRIGDLINPFDLFDSIQCLTASLAISDKYRAQQSIIIIYQSGLKLIDRTMQVRVVVRCAGHVCQMLCDFDIK